MLTKTNEYKLEEGRGKGHGRDYKPWIETREVSSSGTCSNPIDWKTGPLNYYHKVNRISGISFAGTTK